jgi:hypothetical protein
MICFDLFCPFSEINLGSFVAVECLNNPSFFETGRLYGVSAMPFAEL